MTREGSDQVPEEFSRMALSFADPATPTMAAQSDAAAKLVAAGVLPAESEVTQERVGLSASDRRRIATERRSESAHTTVALLAATESGALSPAASNGALDPVAVKAAADALGVLVRAGVDPDQAAERVGLAGLMFTGAIPVSLRPLETQASQLESS